MVVLDNLEGKCKEGVGVLVWDDRQFYNTDPCTVSTDAQLRILNFHFKSVNLMRFVWNKLFSALEQVTG
jgi:hypothetical protein